MLKRIQGAVVVLAAAGIVLPPQAICAAESQKNRGNATVSQIFADVRFSSDGSFNGRVVDSAGTFAKNAEVVVRQGKKEITRCKADEKGVFSISKLKSGTYQVSSGTTEGYFRVWEEQAAPPAARKYALLVLGQNGERGKFGAIGNAFDAIEPDMSALPGLDPTLILLTAGVIGGVVVGAIALEKIDRIDKRVSELPPASP